MMLVPNPAAPVPPTITVDSVWLPKANSTLAPYIDSAWWTVMWVCIAFFILLMGMMFYFMFKYRRKTDGDITSDLDHNAKLEVLWTVIPLAIVIALFFVGFKGFIHASVPPAETIDINLTARKWVWQFNYPNGVSSDELHVPVGKPVRMIMSSQDVVHSFYVPEFRVKRDVIPGLYTSVWFEAREPGETALECAEYCGGAGDGSKTTGHSGMWARVVIHKTPEEFDTWLENEGGGKLPPAEYGKKIYAGVGGCMGCHATAENPAPTTGPSFRGLWGRTETMSDGTVIHVTGEEGDNYLRESIMQSQAKLVKGYQGVMPIFQGSLNDKQVAALIAFIKEQK